MKIKAITLFIITALAVIASIVYSVIDIMAKLHFLNLQESDIYAKGKRRNTTRGIRKVWL